MAGTNRSGGDRRSSGADPFPVDGPPKPPTDLPAEEKKLWRDLLKQIPAELLRKVDGLQLRVLVATIEQEKRLAKVLRKDPADLPTQRAYLQVVAHISRLSGQFGLSPVDRARLKLAPPSDDDDAEDWEQS